jgi:hypothetical protein
MSAVAGDSIDFGNALDTQLHPARRAMCAHSAAAVVVLHRAHPDLRLVFGNTRPNRHDDTARFMSRNDRAASGAETQRCGTSGCAVKLEIAATHPRGLNLQHNLTRTRLRIWELKDLNFAVTSKDDTFHFSHLLYVRQRAPKLGLDALCCLLSRAFYFSPQSNSPTVSLLSQQLL